MQIDVTKDDQGNVRVILDYTEYPLISEELSKALTGCKESFPWAGITVPDTPNLVQLLYGNNAKVELDFSLRSYELLPSDDPETILNVLLRRMEAALKARAKWIAEHVGTASAEIADSLPELASTLKTEKRLFYKTASGELKELD